MSKDLLKCWNEGTIENTTYYNTTSFQFANRDISRFNWAQYDFGIEFSGVRYSVSGAGLSFNWKTDNSTYYVLNWSRTISIGPRDIYFQYTYGQKLSDDYVNMTLRVVATRGFSTNAQVNVYQKIMNIKLGGNASTNALIYNNSRAAFLNETPKNYTNGITDFEVKLGNYWNQNIIFLFDTYNRLETLKNTPNNDVDVVVYRNLSNNVAYDFTHYWIDATDCRPNAAYCLLNGLQIISANRTLTQNLWSNTSTNKIQVHGLMVLSAPIGLCPIVPSDCYFRFMENTTTTAAIWTEIKNNVTVDRNATCSVTNTSTCSQSPWYITNDETSQIAQIFTRWINISCDRNETINVRLNYSTNIGKPIVHYTSAAYNLSCPNETGAPIPSIVYPANNSNYTSGNNSFNITCNAYDLYPIKNATIYSDFTGSWTSNFTWTDKMRTNVTNLTNIYNISDTVYNIGCYACDNNGYCGWSRNITIGNYTAPAGCSVPASGNWTITTNVTCTNEIKTVPQSIFIMPYCSLTLKNSNFTMNLQTNIIYIKAGGWLYADRFSRISK